MKVTGETLVMPLPTKSDNQIREAVNMKTFSVFDRDAATLGRISQIQKAGGSSSIGIQSLTLDSSSYSDGRNLQGFKAMGKLKAQVQIVLNNNYCSFEAGGELKGHILLNIDEH